MEHKDKTIGFAEDLVSFVKEGSKKLTYRLGDKLDFLQIGDIIPVRNSLTGEIFGSVEIVNIGKMPFKDLPIDAEGHEKYESKAEQKKVFEKYYPGVVKDDSEVKIIAFKFLD